MIRVEYTANHPFVKGLSGGTFIEDDMESAKEYVKTMREADFPFVEVRYYDKETRVDHIRHGKLITLNDPSLALEIVKYDV